MDAGYAPADFRGTFGIFIFKENVRTLGTGS